jgi:hypothetical protein
MLFVDMGIPTICRCSEQVCIIGVVIAAHDGSRELSYLSTAPYVDGLNFWVRDGSRCVPAAMAAITVVEDQRSSPQEAILTDTSLKAKVRI